MDQDACQRQHLLSLHSLRNYYNLLYPDDNNTSFHEMFFKVYGITYDQYLKNQEDLDDEINKLDYKEIPHRKLILKKNNIKTKKGSFLQTLNTFQTIVKSKKGKRIILLNFLIRETAESPYLFDIFCYDGAKVGRNNNNDLIVSFSKEIPVNFEVDYFTIKVKEQEPLQVFKEVHEQINYITPRMYEITKNIQKILS